MLQPQVQISKKLWKEDAGKPKEKLEWKITLHGQEVSEFGAEGSETDGSHTKKLRSNQGCKVQQEIS